MYRSMRDTDEDEELKSELDIAKNFNGLKNIEDTESFAKNVKEGDEECVDSRYLVSDDDY